MVVIQALHQRVVELMCLRAKGFLAFKYHHRRAVGVEFVEHLADMPHRQCRRCVGRVQRGRSFLADHFQLGTVALVTAAIATQNKTMGTASRRTIFAARDSWA